MYKRREENENGKQPEEIAMMPKRGWVGDGEVHGEDQDTRCKPSCLQRLASPWLFIFMVGIGALCGDALLMYLKFQGAGLRRQFKVDNDTITWMSYSSEIACAVSAVFLSILAKKIHLPRALAISSVVLGIASILCVVPYAVTKGDLVPAPRVLENETYSMDKFKMMASSCIVNKKAMAVFTKLMKEAAMSDPGQEANKPKEALGSTPASKVEVTGTNVTTSLKRQNASEPSQGGRTIIIPDFQKLSTHPNFKQFVGLAKGMGIKLEEVAAMDLDGQVNYVEGLSPEVKAMLPNLKLMLGDDPDSYFIQVHVDDTGSHRVKRSTRKERINLKTDMAYTGQLVKIMPPLPPGIMEKAFKELCPFNTGPLMVNASTGVLKVINAALILQGIARGPRLAYAAMFLLENSVESSLSLHFGVFFGVSFLCVLFNLMMSVYVSASVYITMEDVGHMTMFNPRWLPAWWVGFIIMALFSFLCAAALFLLPRKLKNSKIYAPTTTSDDRSCYSCGGYIKDLLATSFRVFTNPVYLAMVLGTLFTFFAWTGLLHVSFNYVIHQFSLGSIEPGLYIMSSSTFFFAVGVIIGGVISYKCKFSSLGHLKFAVVLACFLVIIHACNLGLGCSQPSVDKGQRIVPHISNDTFCGSTCPCNDLGFSPSCGSDGRTYYSPCHAGCGEGYDGKFHDCKCLEDTERTVTPGYCPQCDFYYPFFVVFCLGGFIAGLQFVPSFTATFRSVKRKDVPVALGFLTMLMICVVSIPSPSVYQTAEDNQCVNKIYECGILNTCTQYNIEKVRFHVFGLSLALQAISALLFIVAFLFGRKSSIYHEQIYATEQVKS